MTSLWQELPSSRIATTIDHVGEDLLQNIFGRLPAFSFASAACVSGSWNLICNHILCCPKLSSACLANPSLQVAIEGVVNKVLSEPIRPHFAIAYVGPFFGLQEAHQLITAKLGSKVPVVTNRPAGIIGRDEFYNEFKEILWKLSDIDGYRDDNDDYDDEDDDDDDVDDDSANTTIMLIVGFLPGIKVRTIPFIKQLGEYKRCNGSSCNFSYFLDKIVFLLKIFILTVDLLTKNSCWRKAVMELMDYFMSPETVIVGDCFSRFHFTNGSSKNITVIREYVSAVALVFVVDRNKPLGVRETQFHAVLSSGLVPVGSVYAAFVKKSRRYSTELTERSENPYGGRMFRQAYEELGDEIGHVHIGVIKRRKYSEKVGWGTSLAFHKVLRFNKEYLEVGCADGIETGDTFCFYQPDFTTALSSIANVSNHLRSFKQRDTTGNYKRRVFGGLMFTSCKRSESFLGKTNIDSSPFLNNSSGMTFGRTFCHRVFGRGHLMSCDKESQEQKLVHCRAHEYGVVYLIMSYTP